MVPRWVILLLLPALAGCLVPWTEGGGIPGASQWTWGLEDSMLPDFADEGDSYPVLAIHHHQGPSERTQQEWARNPPVCSTSGGEPLPIFLFDAAEACAPSSVDTATGRLFVPRETFDEWDPRAVIVFPESCGGAVQSVSGDGRFVLPSVGHDFQVELRDGAFVVDGVHVVPPGKTLKVTYWTDYGDRMDQRYVRVVFDNPGQWLVSQVGGQEFQGTSRPTSATLDSNGRVLEASLPWKIEDLADAVTPLVTRGIGADAELVALRFAVADGGLTELFATTHDDRGTIQWYLASRDGDSVRILGNQSLEHTDGSPSRHFLEAFPGPILDYTSSGLSHRFEWLPSVGYESVSGLAVERGLCDECARLWTDPLAGDPGWYAVPDAQAVESAGEWTLRLTAYAADGSEARQDYHRPGS